MVNISTFGDSAIKFTFTDSDHYLYGNGEITVPVNSLSLVIDESDMACFKKGDGDTFIAFNIANSNFASKDVLIEFYKENMVSEGGGVPEEEIQEMITSATSGYADSVLYNSTSKYVEFYHGGTGGTKVYEFDASDFVIDGMVDDVRIETIGGVSYLVIDFNTASGKQDIQIPLTDIFDPSNYYTKTDIDTKLGSGFTSSSVTEVIESNERVVANAINSLNAEISGKQDTLSAGTNITISGNVISAEGGGKAIEGGRGISITTGATADTVSFDLPIYKTVSGTAYSLVLGTSSEPSADKFKAKYNTYINCRLPYVDYNSGTGNLIMGESCSAMGYSNDSFVGGFKSKIGYLRAFAFGARAEALANDAVAFGNGGQAKGDGSFACGDGTSANTAYSFATGYRNFTTSRSEFTSGQYNNSVSASTTFGDSGNTLFSVGNGTANNARHNAFEIRQNGDIYITSGGTDIKLQDNLGSTIEISSAITSGDTNPVQGGAIYDKFDEVETVTAAALNSLNDNFDGLKLKKVTQAEYDNIVSGGTVDNSTLYVITNS